MIKLEHTVLPSPDQMAFVIEGMRNPMNSWDKSDSEIQYGLAYGLSEDSDECYVKGYTLGDNDYDLMKRLAKAGTDHRKFIRMMPVYVRITAPLYWWKEADTYKIGTVANSCSTMHKIQEKEFTTDDFSCEHLDIRTKELLEETIKILNDYRKLYIEYNPDDFEIKGCPSKKDIWWQMIQLLPSSYNQTTNFIVNNDLLWYIDYECNTYMEEWNFENWGIKYWSKTPELIDYYNRNK